MTPSRQQDYLTMARQHTAALLEAYLALKAMQTEWNAQAIGDNPFDGVGANEGYTSAQAGAVVFDTMSAIDTLMAAGHATNLTNLL